MKNALSGSPGSRRSFVPVRCGRRGRFGRRSPLVQRNAILLAELHFVGRTQRIRVVCDYRLDNISNKNKPKYWLHG
jgi:hypothetical protein